MGVVPSVNKKWKMVEKKAEKWKKKGEGKGESWNALSERGASHLICEYQKIQEVI